MRRSESTASLSVRTVCATLLALALASGANAATPEEEAGCPEPTLEECLQPGYLFGTLDDPDGPPCGALQGANDWTCSRLLQEHFETYGYDTSSSIYAGNLDQSGVAADVVQIPQDAEDAGASYFSGELSSPPNYISYGTSLFHDGQVILPDGTTQSFAAFGPAETDSQVDSMTFAGLDSGSKSTPDTWSPAGSLAIEDPRAYWPDNGERFSSCQEYAWERFLEVTRFWYVLGTVRHNYLEAFQMAFAPDGIGTAHLNGSGFLDVNEEEVLPSAREDVFRNRFFRLPKYPRKPGEDKVPGSPNLRRCLKLYDPQLGEFIVNRIENAHDKKVTKDMSYYWQYWENMTVEGTPSPGPSFKNPGGDDDSGEQGRFVLDDGDDGHEGLIGGAESFANDSDGGDGGSGSFADAGGGDGDGGVAIGDALFDGGDPGALFEITGQVPLEFSDGFPMRRRFAAELDELYDLQLQKDALLDEWAALDKRYGANGGSGWTIETLLLELNPLVFVPMGDFEVDSFMAEEEDGGNGMVGGSAEIADGPQDPYVFLTPESAARKRVLDGLLAVYDKARECGCLHDWVTPCDFSPKEFAREGVTHAIEEQQRAFEECQQLLPGTVHGNEGTTRTIINFLGDMQRLSDEIEAQANESQVDQTLDDVLADADDELLDLHAQLAELGEGCVLHLDDVMTATHLRWIADQTATCLENSSEYYAKLAEFEAAVMQHLKEEALARVAAIPELIDPDTGDFVRPGVSASWSEDKGSKYFGLDLGYEYKFDTELGADECGFELTAGGYLYAHAKVLGARKELIDAAAWLRTAAEEEDQVHLHAEVLGVPLFTAISVNGLSDGEEYSKAVTETRGAEASVQFGTTFLLGVIPIGIDVGIGGRVGFSFGLSAGLGYTSNGCASAALSGKLGPSVGVFGFIEVGVDLLVLRGGIRGELDIIVAHVPVWAEMRLTTAGADPTVSVGIGADLKMETLSGRIEAFGEIGPCPLCKRVEKTLVRWDGFKMEKSLFEQTYEVSIGDLITAMGQEG